MNGYDAIHDTIQINNRLNARLNASGNEYSLNTKYELRTHLATVH